MGYVWPWFSPGPPYRAFRGPRPAARHYIELRARGPPARSLVSPPPCPAHLRRPLPPSPSPAVRRPAGGVTHESWRVRSTPAMDMGTVQCCEPQGRQAAARFELQPTQTDLTVSSTLPLCIYSFYRNSRHSVLNFFLFDASSVATKLVHLQEYLSAERLDCIQLLFNFGFYMTKNIMPSSLIWSTFHWTGTLLEWPCLIHNTFIS